MSKWHHEYPPKDTRSSDYWAEVNEGTIVVILGQLLAREEFQLEVMSRNQKKAQAKRVR